MRTQAQIMAIMEKNKARIKEICSDADEASGIYSFQRREENGIPFGYVGQAKHLLSRLAQHLDGYQRIDLSIKKHGLYSETKPYGYKVVILKKCGCDRLDEWEKYFIKDFIQCGIQLRNNTLGGQGEGKVSIADTPRKGYLAGKHDGYLQARKEFIELLKNADGDGRKADNARRKIDALKVGA